jgi:hypothetical protein
VSVRALATIVSLVVAFAAGTWLLGWWTVPVVALAYGLWNGRSVTRAPGSPVVALAAALAWGLLLAAAAVSAPVAALAGRLGALMGQPSFALYAATLLFPALLAWSAAALGHAIGEPQSTQ